MNVSNTGTNKTNYSNAIENEANKEALKKVVLEKIDEPYENINFRDLEFGSFTKQTKISSVSTKKHSLWKQFCKKKSELYKDWLWPFFGQSEFKSKLKGVGCRILFGTDRDRLCNTLWERIRIIVKDVLNDTFVYSSISSRLEVENQTLDVKGKIDGLNLKLANNIISVFLLSDNLKDNLEDEIRNIFTNNHVPSLDIDGIVELIVQNIKSDQSDEDKIRLLFHCDIFKNINLDIEQAFQLCIDVLDLHKNALNLNQKDIVKILQKYKLWAKPIDQVEALFGLSTGALNNICKALFQPKLPKYTSSSWWPNLNNLDALMNGNNLWVYALRNGRTNREYLCDSIEKIDQFFNESVKVWETSSKSSKKRKKSQISSNAKRRRKEQEGSKNAHQQPVSKAVKIPSIPENLTTQTEITTDPFWGLEDEGEMEKKGQEYLEEFYSS